MQKKKTIYLKDYTPPPYLVRKVDLRFDLDPVATLVSASLSMEANSDNPGPLVLDGEELELERVWLDGRELDRDEYVFGNGVLRIDRVPDRFTLDLQTRINPRANTALEGLYLSSGNYCTQCEAEGFRRITCYPDRPDVMAVFTTTIVADRDQCPVLLSNGNLVEEGVLDDGRHFARWHDPFPKPSYLFALVAGNLTGIRDRFRTMNGREIELWIYVEPQNRDKCGHAMASLKKAMRWDEENYGREYDLERYMIVAVDDFNMGAMENKGLNIFNSRYVLALPETATDQDYEGIEGVIAHEYFHNWTGNRITCRDWFQLSLKEGLTVFRDQQFTSDMTSAAVKRIHDANVIRSFQFREDAGPMAHPVRPESFVEINNFYTLTVYNKGAEVIRMLHTLLGPETFRRGMGLYFSRHDGQAVTCDDFVQAMADSSGQDLSRFKRWYSQAGTPELDIRSSYDPASGTLQLEMRQQCPATPGQKDKKPFVIPVRTALLDKQGKTVAERLLVLEREKQSFTFTGIREACKVSVLRDFSAPVKLRMRRSSDELAFLMAHDSDPFNRWDSGQQLAMQVVLENLETFGRSGWQLEIPEIYHTAFARLLADEDADQAFLALALTLPTENWISQQLSVVDPVAVFMVRQRFRMELAARHGRVMLERYHALAPDGPYRYSPKEAGRRSLRNVLLSYLLAVVPGEAANREYLRLAEDQFHGSDNMTDLLAALGCVVNSDRQLGGRLLDEMYQRWHHDPLVMDKWLSIQATSPLPGTLEQVKELTGHPAFSDRNPNKIRALIGAFGSGNNFCFHEPGGAGYAFVADWVLRIDGKNPQIAARLLTPLTLWRRYDAKRKDLMRSQLERIAAQQELSPDVREIVQRSLA